MNLDVDKSQSYAEQREPAPSHQAPWRAGGECRSDECQRCQGFGQGRQGTDPGAATRAAAVRRQRSQRDSALRQQRSGTGRAVPQAWIVHRNRVVEYRGPDAGSECCSCDQEHCGYEHAVSSLSALRRPTTPWKSGIPRWTGPCRAVISDMVCSFCSAPAMGAVPVRLIPQRRETRLDLDARPEHLRPRRRHRPALLMRRQHGVSAAQFPWHGALPPCPMPRVDVPLAVRHRAAVHHERAHRATPSNAAMTSGRYPSAGAGGATGSDRCR